jgi:hypothetical protein
VPRSGGRRGDGQASGRLVRCRSRDTPGAADAALEVGGIRSPCRTSRRALVLSRCSDEFLVVSTRPARRHLRQVLEAHSVWGIHPDPADEVVHIRCRSQQLRLDTLDERDRSRLAVDRATDLLEGARRRRLSHHTQLTQRRDGCPVCAGSAMLTDWRPRLDWMTVEECPCRGFFIWTPLLDDGRLARLTPEDRETLSERLRHLRATESEAWLVTRDGTVMGALTIRAERPDRAHHFEPRATVADDGIPFTLAGQVAWWDPATRVLYVGSQRLSVPPSAPADFLTRDLSVTITGRRPREESATWTVTEIQPHQPGS